MAHAADIPSASCISIYNNGTVSLSWYLARYLGRFLDHSVGIVIFCLLLFLHIQVVLNRKKEFQWQRLALFLRVGATRYAQLILLSQI